VLEYRAGRMMVIMVATTTNTSRKSTRYLELRQMLEDRRLELMNEVHGKIRNVRTDKGKDRESLNPGESSEIDIQEDIELALIQMKFETLNKINEALKRLEEDSYGNCFECGEEINEARLRALLFAVRCKDCEEVRELAEREKLVEQRLDPSISLFDISN
jgi:DnaK suppressor protein